MRRWEAIMNNLPEKYIDMLDMPRPVSLKHPPLSRESRAAQFSPFAALTGYDNLISESEIINELQYENPPKTEIPEGC